MITLGLAGWATSLLVALSIVTSVALILFVLIQRPQGGGLSGAFGSGAGSGQTAFGTKTGDVLTISTVAMFVIWVGFAIALQFAARPSEQAPRQGAAQGIDGGEAPPADTNGPPPPGNEPSEQSADTPENTPEDSERPGEGSGGDPNAGDASGGEQSGQEGAEPPPPPPSGGEADSPAPEPDPPSETGPPRND